MFQNETTIPPATGSAALSEASALSPSLAMTRRDALGQSAPELTGYVAQHWQLGDEDMPVVHANDR